MKGIEPLQAITDEIKNMYILLQNGLRFLYCDFVYLSEPTISETVCIGLRNHEITLHTDCWHMTTSIIDAEGYHTIDSLKKIYPLRN